MTTAIAHTARNMTAPAATPVAVVDLLTSLLESAVNSVFRFVAEGSPYLSRASAEIRRPLQEMVIANNRRASELAATLESLGAPAVVRAEIRSDEQYLAYLSLKFLLPKLVDEKKLCIRRYANAIESIGRLPQVPADVPALLRAHRAELETELTALEHAAAAVAPAKKNGDPSKPAAGTAKNSDAGPSAG